MSNLSDEHKQIILDRYKEPILMGNGQYCRLISINTYHDVLVEFEGGLQVPTTLSVFTKGLVRSYTRDDMIGVVECMRCGVDAVVVAQDNEHKKLTVRFPQFDILQTCSIQTFWNGTLQPKVVSLRKLGYSDDEIEQIIGRKLKSKKRVLSNGERQNRLISLQDELQQRQQKVKRLQQEMHKILDEIIQLTVN